MEKYLLHWEFGLHHINVFVSKKDFFNVIDDLSNEFTIYKLHDVNRIIYQIENYYGEMSIIGEVLND